MTEAQQRFLKEIADRVSGGRVAEVRLYPTVRVGPVESGVAIVAKEEPAPTVDSVVAGEASPDEAPVLEATVTADADAVAPADLPVGARADRMSILTAHFRHTVKGPDRGKWEFSMVHDADAPIETVESVVRGVARRAGEDGEPELLSGADFRDAITKPWWTATS